MSSRGVGRDFDALSSVYDETRQPLDPETIRHLGAFFEDHRWSSPLEVGVGTGRIARSLRAEGLRVVGVDASRGMLARAAAKGVPDLVRGTAYRLPFADRAFDVALFVHVLHVLDDPTAGLREAARVSRHGVLALMDRAPNEPESDGTSAPSPRSVVREVLGEVGFPDLLKAGPRVREGAILHKHPPREMRVLSDRTITEPLSKQLDAIEKRAYRHVLRVPPETLARAVALARERLGSRTITYRRTESVVWWDLATIPR